MNKSYTYIDGKIIVIDDNNHQVLKEYQDNIDEILKEENLIEEMKNEINNLNNKYDNLKYIKNKKFIPFYIPIIIGATFLSCFIVFDLLGHGGGDKIVETIFGKMPFKTIATNFMVVFTLPLATMMDLLEYGSLKEKKKEFCATESKLEFLNKQIKKNDKSIY